MKYLPPLLSSSRMQASRLFKVRYFEPHQAIDDSFHISHGFLSYLKCFTTRMLGFLGCRCLSDDFAVF